MQASERNYELWAMEAQARAAQCEELLADAQAKIDALLAENQKLRDGKSE